MEKRSSQTRENANVNEDILLQVTIEAAKENTVNIQQKPKLNIIYVTYTM